MGQHSNPPLPSKVPESKTILKCNIPASERKITKKGESELYTRHLEQPIQISKGKRVDMDSKSSYKMIIRKKAYLRKNKKTAPLKR